MSEFGIGYTYIQELKKQHHNLERFRSAFEEKRNILEEKDAYSYDRLIEFSSDAKGNVGSKIDNLRPKLIWCINHYLGLNRHPRVIKATQQEKGI